MTTITPDTSHYDTTSQRNPWKAVVAFVAGAAFATSVAVGISAAADDDAAPSSEGPATATAVAFQPSDDGGCLVGRGPC